MKVLALWMRYISLKPVRFASFKWIFCENLTVVYINRFKLQKVDWKVNSIHWRERQFSVSSKCGRLLAVCFSVIILCAGHLHTHAHRSVPCSSCAIYGCDCFAVHILASFPCRTTLHYSSNLVAILSKTMFKTNNFYAVKTLLTITNELVQVYDHHSKLLTTRVFFW